MTDDQKRLLEKQLWGVANVLRGKMHSDEYRNYILSFIFYKYLSEKLESYVNTKLLIGEKFEFADIKENSNNGKEVLKAVKGACLGHLGYFLKPTELFSYIVKKGVGEIEGENTFIIEELKNVLNTIERTSMGSDSEDDFKGLFADVDLTSSKLGSRENQKNDVIVEVLTLLSGIDFKLEDSKSDLLGDAYEYLIGEFAAGAGKKGGEFYTPAQVSRLLAQIVTQDKKRVRSVYDATCGSGSLLLRVNEFTEVAEYFGQELNPTTFNLARMNMILHGVHFAHFDIRRGDTLQEDLHPNLKAEVIVANPPFSAKWKSDSDPELTHDDRFSQYGRLAPKSAADYAFLTHMLSHLADNGTMAIVLPHGVLFRSGAEGHIRKYIIEKQNYLDAVIGLPSNLFYGNAIPVIVLVFKKCRKDDEDILFIDASKEFKKGKNQNNLTNENIQKIFETYTKRKEIEKYSHLATMDEIKENEYNLNIPRYVDISEEEELIDLKIISKKLLELKNLEKKNEKKMNTYCEELNIPKPNGNNLPLLNKYKKGIIQQIFNQIIRFRKEDNSEFPEWEEKLLEDVFENQGGAGLEKYVVNSGKYKFISIGNYSKNGLYLDNLQRISLNEKTKNKMLNKNDLVMVLNDKTAAGDIIGSTILIDKDDTYIYNQRSERLICTNQIDSKFAWFYLNSRKFRKNIFKISQGGTQIYVNFPMVKKLKILLPSFSEQKKIASFLTAINSLIETKQE